MKFKKLGLELRIFFAVQALFIWLGIFLTGLTNACWILFIPAAMLSFAAIAGICPAIMVIRKIVGKKEESE